MGGTGNRCSPRTCRGSRLVASTRTAGAAASRSRDARPDIGDLLEVVEQQEDVLIVQAALELLEDGLLATVRRTHGVGDQPQRGARRRSRGEVDEDRRRRERPWTSAAARSARRVLPLPPGPTRVTAGRRHGEQACECRQLALPADERRGGRGQAATTDIDGHERREVGSRGPHGRAGAGRSVPRGRAGVAAGGESAPGV